MGRLRRYGRKGEQPADTESSRRLCTIRVWPWWPMSASGAPAPDRARRAARGVPIRSPRHGELRELVLQGPAVQPEHARRLRDVSVALAKHALDMLMLQARE